MTEVEIRPPFIKLEQLLKYINVSETGGTAKFLIQDGQIKVDGEVCLMRGKKLRGGEIVTVPDGGEYLCVMKNSEEQ